MQRVKPNTHKRPNGFSKMRWPVQKYQISHAGPKILVYSCERLSSMPF